MTKFTGDVVIPGFVETGARVIEPVADPAPDYSFAVGLVEFGGKVFESFKTKKAISGLVSELEGVGIEDDEFVQAINNTEQVIHGLSQLDPKTGKTVGSSAQILTEKSRLLKLRTAQHQDHSLRRNAIIRKFAVNNPELIGVISSVDSLTANLAGGPAGASSLQRQREAQQKIFDDIAENTGQAQFRDPDFLSNNPAAQALLEVFTENKTKQIENDFVKAHMEGDELAQAQNIIGLGRDAADTANLIIQASLKGGQADIGQLIGFVRRLDVLGVHSKARSLGVTGKAKEALDATTAQLEALKTDIIGILTNETDTSVVTKQLEWAQARGRSLLWATPGSVAAKELTEWLANNERIAPGLTQKLALTDSITGLQGTMISDVVTPVMDMLQDPNSKLHMQYNLFSLTSNAPIGSRAEVAKQQLDVYKQIVSSLGEDLSPEDTEAVQQFFNKLFNDTSSIEGLIEENPSIVSRLVDIASDPKSAKYIANLDNRNRFKQLLSTQVDRLGRALQKESGNILRFSGIREAVSGVVDLAGVDTEFGATGGDPASVIHATITENGDVLFRPKGGLEGQALDSSRRFSNKLEKKGIGRELGRIARAASHLQGNNNYSDMAGEILKSIGIGDRKVEAPSGQGSAFDSFSINDATPSDIEAVSKEADLLAKGSGEVLSRFLTSLQEGNEEEAMNLLREMQDKYPSVLERVAP